MAYLRYSVLYHCKNRWNKNKDNVMCIIIVGNPNVDQLERNRLLVNHNMYWWNKSRRLGHQGE